jgi:magnesium-transporting ATPase (P-type)
MVERILLSAAVMGGVTFALYRWLLAAGWTLAAARNSALFLMVLFENVNTFNSRSERRSVFSHNPLRNPLLLFGTLAAQAIHIGALYTPGLREVLRLEPIPLPHWGLLTALALALLLAIELHKAARGRLRPPRAWS